MNLSLNMAIVYSGPFFTETARDSWIFLMCS